VGARLHKKGLEHASDPERRRETDRQSDRQLHQGSFEEEPDHLTWLRAEDHVHADVAGTLRHGVRRHGIQANRREHERDEGEGSNMVVNTRRSQRCWASASSIVLGLDRA
jgi:hypothetical protein